MSAIAWRVMVLATSGALLAGAVPARAQGRPAAAGESLVVTASVPGIRAGGDAMSAAPGGSFPASERESDAIIARGTPRSFQIVTVPVPAVFGDSTAVSFEVVTNGTAPLLGARQGVLVPNGARPRSFALTVGVPARALAGRRRVAQVRFATRGMADVVTPVEIDVEPIRRIDPLVTPALVGGRAGADVTLHLRLTNLGNAPDTVSVHVQAADTTNAVMVRGFDSEPIVLGVNTARDRVLRVALSRSIQPSVLAVALSVRGSDGVERSRAEASVEVVSSARADGASSPMLTTSVAAPLGGAARGAAMPALAVGVQGPVGHDLRIDGRWTRVATDDPMANAGLTRLGYYDLPPSLALASPSWRVAGGGSGARLTDLTGGSAWGVGAAGTLYGERWRGAAMIAQPGFSRHDPTTGVLAGATASHRVGAAWVTGSFAHMLEDQELFARRLDALSVGARIPTVLDATLDAEVAGRRWDGGSALGARIEAERRSAHDNATLRLLHAPGGSAAFAPARDELSASASRVLAPRWLLSGSGWLNSDGGVLTRGMHSSGWSVQPQYSLSDRTSIALRAQASGFDMDGLGTRLRTGDRELSGVLSTRRNTLYGSGSFGVGTNSRESANEATSLRFSERLVRSTTEVIGGWTSALGTLELDATAERNLRGTGLTPDRSRLGVRVDRLAVYPNWSGVYLSGSVQRSGWLGERQRATIATAALSSELPYRLRATLGLQHNSFFAPSMGRWTTVIGVDRSVALPRRHHHRSGIVYEDLNGNGMRDADEQGFAGAVVRSGSATVATSADGRFKLPAVAQPTVDSRSLPVGWLPGAAPAAAAKGAVELAVIPTSVIEVDLVAVASSDGRVPSTDLRAVDVMARDAADHLWMARLTPSGIAVFDALPPGDYRLELDLSRLTEPLATAAPLPAFVVQAAPSRRRYSVPVMPRPLKMWRPPARAPNDSTARPPAAKPTSGGTP
jgi:hypothetical protein